MEERRGISVVVEGMMMMKASVPENWEDCEKGKSEGIHPFFLSEKRRSVVKERVK